MATDPEHVDDGIGASAHPLSTAAYTPGMTDINANAVAARESSRVSGKFGEQRGINPPEQPLADPHVQGDDGNPYGASAEAIAAADKVGVLLRAGDPNQEGADLIARFCSTPSGKAQYYAALSTHAELTPEAQGRLSALMDAHDIDRADVDTYIEGEFGMGGLSYSAPNGSEASFREHPNRIINRIDDDYLDEIARFASRDKHDS